MNRLRDMRNISQDMERKLIEVGIETPEELYNVGSCRAWIRLTKLYPDLGINKLMGLEGAIEGIRWPRLRILTRRYLQDFYKNHYREINMKKIVVAGGCFWGVEEYFRRLKGIESTRVGYAQGHLADPTYKDVKAQVSGHAEVVEVYYDRTIISFEKILEHLFRIIDPTSLNKQGEDEGTSYRTGIYYETDEELNRINEFINSVKNNYEKEIVVEVEKLDKFFDAEEYHQKYLVVNPTGYCHVDFSKIKDEELK